MGGNWSHFDPLGLLGKLKSVQCLADVLRTGRHTEDHGDEATLGETISKHPGERSVSIGDERLPFSKGSDYVAQMKKALIDSNSFSSPTS